MTTAERKRGKHERIKGMLNNLLAQRKPMVEDQHWLAEVLDGPGSGHLTAGKETAFAGHPDANEQELL